MGPNQRKIDGGYSRWKRRHVLYTNQHNLNGGEFLNGFQQNDSLYVFLKSAWLMMKKQTGKI